MAKKNNGTEKRNMIDIKREAMEKKADKLRQVIVNADERKQKAGYDLARAIIAFIDVQKLKTEKAKASARIEAMKNMSERSGFGLSTLREYVRFSLPENAKKIAEAKAETIDEKRAALKGTASKSKGGGANGNRHTKKAGAKVSTPKDAKAKLTHDAKLPIDEQVHALMEAVANAIDQNSESDRELMWKMVAERVAVERGRFVKEGHAS